MYLKVTRAYLKVNYSRMSFAGAIAHMNVDCAFVCTCLVRIGGRQHVLFDQRFWRLRAD